MSSEVVPGSALASYRARWAQRLTTGLENTPPYGTETWARLQPGDDRKIAAAIRAAEAHWLCLVTEHYEREDLLFLRQPQDAPLGNLGTRVAKDIHRRRGVRR